MGLGLEVELEVGAGAGVGVGPWGVGCGAGQMEETPPHDEVSSFPLGNSPPPEGFPKTFALGDHFDRNDRRDLNSSCDPFSSSPPAPPSFSSSFRPAISPAFKQAIKFYGSPTRLRSNPEPRSVPSTGSQAARIPQWNLRGGKRALLLSCLAFHPNRRPAVPEGSNHSRQFLSTSEAG